jgi:hypothetical protein
MTSANPNGMKKNTNRNSMGGKMMSHLPRRFSHSPREARAVTCAGVSPDIVAVMGD